MEPNTQLTEFNRFQQKLMRRLTSPVEIAYSITSHWFLVLTCIVVATLALVVYAVQQAPVYSATATLILKSPQRMFGGLLGTNVLDDDQGSYVAEQVRILQSDSVLADTVRSLKYHKERPRDEVEEIEDDSPVGMIRKLVKRGEEFVEQLLPSQTQQPVSEDMRARIALESFRRRAKVMSMRGSNQVKLQLRGMNRQTLEKEIDHWIQAYQGVLRRFARERTWSFLSRKSEHWNSVVSEAKARVDEFLKSYPDASESMLKYLRERVIRQQLLLDRMRLQFDEFLASKSRGVVQVAPQPQIQRVGPVPTEESLIGLLEEKVRALNMQRLELLGKHPEGSDIVQQHDETIRAVEREIVKLRQRRPSILGPGEKDDAESALELFKKRIEYESSELEKLRSRQAEIENLVAKLQEYVKDYNDKASRKDEWERQLLQFQEAQEASQVRVFTLDKPTAELEPLNPSKKMQVMAGAFGGLFLGVVLAFCIELFSRRIRFKRDVELEQGLEVVGVLPEK